jgi:hypothetical protein
MQERVRTHLPELLPLGVLILIVLAGLILRVTGMAATRPFVYYPDEWAIAKPAMHIALTGDLNPHSFFYPTLLINAEAGVASLVHLVSGLSLAFPPMPRVAGMPSGSQADFPADTFPFLLWGRRMVAVLSVLICVLVALAARATAQADRATGPTASTDDPPSAGSAATGGGEQGRAWLAGLIGAAFMALAVLPLDYSRLLLTDVPSAFFCAATMAATLAAMSRRPDRGRALLFILAGLCVGLAASTKYNAIVVGVVPAMGYLASFVSPAQMRLPRAILARFLSPLPYLMLAASVVGFVIATPMILFDWTEVIGGLNDQIVAYNLLGHVGAQGDDVAYYVTYLWTTGFGPVLSFLAVGGILWALLRHRAVDLVLVVFPVLYFVLVSLPLVRYERNLLPLVPFVALLVGRFVADALELLRGRIAGRSPKSALAAVAIALVALSAQPALMAIDDAQAVSRADTRTVALDWVEANLPAGSMVVREAYTPQLPVSQFRVAYTLSLSDHSLEWYRARGFRYAIASSGQYFRYTQAHTPQADFYDELFRQPVVYKIDPSGSLAGPVVIILDLRPPG